MKRIPAWEILLSLILLLALFFLANSKNPQQHILILTYIGRATASILLLSAILFAGYLYHKQSRLEINQKHFFLMLIVLAFFTFSFVETINSISSQNRLFFSLSLGMFGVISGIFLSRHYLHLRMQKLKPEAPKPGKSQRKK